LGSQGNNFVKHKRAVKITALLVDLKFILNHV